MRQQLKSQNSKFQNSMPQNSKSQILTLSLIPVSIIASFLSLLPFQFVSADTLDGPVVLSSKSFDDLTINGSAKLTEIKAKTLNVNGPLRFNKLEVSGDAKIYGPIGESEEGKFQNLMIKGPVLAKKIMAQSLDIVGPAALKECEIKGSTTIIGPFEALHCKFQDLTITGSEIALEDVTVQNLNIKKTSSGKETLYLKGNTEISGDIRFDSGKGTVTVDGENVKINGKIEGGEKKSAQE